MQLIRCDSCQSEIREGHPGAYRLEYMSQVYTVSTDIQPKEFCSLACVGVYARNRTNKGAG